MTGLPGAPRDSGSDEPSALRSFIRSVASVVNRMNQGGLNNTGSVTLTVSAATTTITDARISVNSAVVLFPTTANAAAAIGTTYASTRNNGSVVLTHTNNAQTDKTFTYAILG